MLVRGAVAAAVGLVALAACTGDDDPGGGSHRPADPIDAQVDEVAAGPSAYGDSVVVGGVLLRQRYDDSTIGTALERSRDLGSTWEPVDLPGTPAYLHAWTSPQILEGMAVVAGDGAWRESRDPVAHVWASSDGITWQGGRLSDTPASNVRAFGAAGSLYVTTTGFQFLGSVATTQFLRSDDGGATWTPVGMEPSPQPGESYDIYDLWQHSDGQLVAPFTYVDSDGNDIYPGEPVFLSEDDGLTWRLGPCPLPNRSEQESCIPRKGTPPSLSIRGDEVSLDAGASWQAPSFDRDVGSDDVPLFEDFVELDGGGWLATGGTNVASEVPYAHLSRSEDGEDWTVLLPIEGKPAATISDPVRFGEGWLVAYSISRTDQDRYPSQLYLVDADGTEVRPIRDTAEHGRYYGQPVVVGDTAVVVALDGDQQQEDARLLRVRL